MLELITLGEIEAMELLDEAEDGIDVVWRLELELDELERLEALEDPRNEAVDRTSELELELAVVNVTNELDVIEVPEEPTDDEDEA